MFDSKKGSTRGGGGRRKTSGSMEGKKCFGRNCLEEGERKTYLQADKSEEMDDKVYLKGLRK